MPLCVFLYLEVEFSKLTVDYVDDMAAAKAFLKNLIPETEVYLQHWSHLPLYITKFDGEYFHLKLSKLGEGDLFKIVVHPNDPRAVIQVPVQSSKNFPKYDTSKYSDKFNYFEDPCKGISGSYWTSKLEGNKYPPIVFKVKPESLMDGLSLKPLLEIKGPTDPNTIHANPNSWYIRYQKMVKDEYFMKEMTREEAKKIYDEADKKKKEFCEMENEKLKIKSSK